MTADFGITDPVCPHCAAALAIFPQRRIRCPECGNHIHSRTRPYDRRKILLRPNQLAELDALWEQVNDQMETLRLFATSFPDEFHPLIDALQSGKIAIDQVPMEAMLAHALRLTHDQLHGNLHILTCPFCVG